MTNTHERVTIQFLDVPQELLESSPAEVVSHLKNGHFQFQNVTIPQIEQQFLGLMKLYPHALTLKVIFNLFQKFQLEMQWHMKQEEKELYPRVLAGSYDKNSAVSHEDQEPFLAEIIQMLRKASYAKNPFGSILIGSLERFEAELRMHAWVEEHLLIQ